GADIVKLFPAASLGIPYYKAIRGPISHVPLMAVGGVDETNVKQFLDAGFISCGIGSSLVRRDLIEAGRFDELTKAAEMFVEALGNQGR
ncbi:MAG: 2-dehydro-3-deoxyphosphogluconate aldolase, partial [Sphaerochaetaceae bacterium]|nr:2-dehydro-3-deoxyphosphogluconate aldolase [Sphaerochaetaceae bacterium]